MSFTNLKFEIPFNLDPKFLDWVNNEGSIYKDRIEFIYMPSFHEDCKNSREKSPAFLKYNPTNRKDYEKLVQKLLDTNCDAAVLLQKDETYHRLNKDLIQYYIDLGFTHFVIGNDYVAEWVKELNPKVETVASLTKVMTYDDVLHKDLDMYDKIVLHHWASRALDALPTLPKKYRYTMMVDIACTYKYPSFCRIHWFCPETEEAKCIERGCCVDRYERESRIFPEDFYLFEPYMSSWKLGFERGSESNFIIDNIHNFMGDHGEFYKYDDYYNMSRREYYNLAIKEGYVKL